MERYLIGLNKIYLLSKGGLLKVLLKNKKKSIAREPWSNRLSVTLTWCLRRTAVLLVLKLAYFIFGIQCFLIGSWTCLDHLKKKKIVFRKINFNSMLYKQRRRRSKKRSAIGCLMEMLLRLFHFEYGFQEMIWSYRISTSDS